MVDIEKLYNEAESFFNKKDYKKAFNIYMECAKENDPESLYMVGYMYEEALGVEENIEEAFKYYKQAADLDFVDAIFNVGFFYD